MAARLVAILPASADVVPGLGPGDLPALGIAADLCRVDGRREGAVGLCRVVPFAVEYVTIIDG